MGEILLYLESGYIHKLRRIGLVSAMSVEEIINLLIYNFILEYEKENGGIV